MLVGRSVGRGGGEAGSCFFTCFCLSVAVPVRVIIIHLYNYPNTNTYHLLSARVVVEKHGIPIYIKKTEITATVFHKDNLHPTGRLRVW